MPNKTFSPSINPINAEDFGNYDTSDYSDKLYAKVYYAIREQQGLSSKALLKEYFAWEELKQRFTLVFGEVEEKRYSLEQMLEYANRKFGKSLQDLLEAHERSWERRRYFAGQQLEQQRSNLVEREF